MSKMDEFKKLKKTKLAMAKQAADSSDFTTAKRFIEEAKNARNNEIQALKKATEVTGSIPNMDAKIGVLKKLAKGAGAVAKKAAAGIGGIGADMVIQQAIDKGHPDNKYNEPEEVKKRLSEEALKKIREENRKNRAM